MITQIPLAIGATGTGAVTALRSSLALPQSLAPVVPPQPLEILLRGTATGAFTSTVLIETSADNSAWGTAATIAFNGTNDAFQTALLTVSAPYIRANISAISGTGTALTIIANVK